MPAEGVVLITLVGAALAAFGSRRVALVSLLTFALIIPAEAKFPYLGPATQILIQRVVLVAFCFGLLRDVLRGRVGAHAFRVRPLFLAVGLWVVISWFNGVVLADQLTSLAAITNPWYTVFEHAVFFGVVVVGFRCIEPRSAATMILVLGGLLGAMAVYEHFTEESVSAWFFDNLADPGGIASRSDLKPRGGELRVRATSLFPLEFAWVAAMLLPLLTVKALQLRRWWAFAAPILLGAGLVWSFTRSAYLGLALGAVLTLVSSGALRRTTQLLPAVAVVALAAILLVPQVQRTFDLGGDSLEEDVRFERLPDIAAAAAESPVTGLGHGGLVARDIPVVDISYVGIYAELGIIGLIGIALLLAAAFRAAFSFLRAPPAQERALAAAAAGGVAAAIIGAASYDFFTLRHSNLTFYALLAFAVATGEHLGYEPTRPDPVRWKLLVPVGGLVVGLGLSAFVGDLASTTMRARLEEPSYTARVPHDNDFSSKVLANSACEMLHSMQIDATLRCRDLAELGGMIEIRIESDSELSVRQAQAEIERRLGREFSGFSPLPIAGIEVGRSTWARTAGLSGLGAGLVIAVLLPPQSRPPARREESDDTDGAEVLA